MNNAIAARSHGGCLAVCSSVILLAACSGTAPPQSNEPSAPPVVGALVGPQIVSPYRPVAAQRPRDGAPATQSPSSAQDEALLPTDTIRVNARETIHPGDTLRVTRDYTGDQQIFVVQPDGRFFYPLVGAVETRGKTPDEVAAQITAAVKPILTTPAVTVNILSSPGNRVYVGGEVKTPGFLDLSGGLTVHQAVLMAGGLLDTADGDTMALARFNAQTDRYDVYFLSFKRLFGDEQSERVAVQLERDDVLFVPKSSIGRAVEMVDLYINRLLPFGRAVGLNYVFQR